MLDSKEQKEKEQIVNFTEVASNKLQSIMKEQNSEGSYLRVSISENPNGGFEYVFGLVDAPEKNDIVVDSIIKTVVDPDSVKFVQGSNIDYVEGFQRSGFVISNPNFQQGGGCGGGGCGGGACGCGGGQAENSSSEQQAQEGGCCGGASAGQGCCQG